MSCRYALEGGILGVDRGRALDISIHVNEEAKIVTVRAGVPQRMLLDHLASYRSGYAP